MPQSALDTGLVDYVLPVSQIPKTLLEWSKRLELSSTPKENEPVLHQLQRICGALLQATGHDFGRYKQGTLIRRIQRRMRVRQTASAADYARLLEDESQEAQALYKDLLIGVTQFFRDPDSFDTLMRQVIPRIFAGKPPGAPLRVWVPGCASGEEPYSIAMLLREYMQGSKRVHPVQIFATDIDDEALAKARKGIYPERIAEDLSPSRLQQFFVQQEKGYEACLELREMCLFSHHNLVKDPPFSSLDLISCRNLLIYLETDLQQKLVPLFHYALQPGGYLFLGPSEGLASHPELFRTLDKKHRLLQRNDAVVAPMIDFPLSGRRWQPTLTQSLAIRGRSGREIQLNTGRVFERLVLEQFAPASVLINEQGEVLYFAGPTHHYLHHRLGAANVNLFDMTQGPLGLEVRAAVRKVAKTRRPLVRENIPLESNETVEKFILKRAFSGPGCKSTV
jgi:two-component system CheB/CheR fusion protein